MAASTAWLQHVPGNDQGTGRDHFPGLGLRAWSGWRDRTRAISLGSRAVTPVRGAELATL